MLVVLGLEYEATLRSMHLEKNKSNKFKFSFINIMLANMNKIKSFSALFDLILILTSIANKSMILEYFRFSRVSEGFQKKIVEIIKSDPPRYTKNLRLFEKQLNKGSVVFYQSLLTMVEHFGFVSKEIEDFIMDIISAEDFMNPSFNNLSKVRAYLTLYRMTMEQSYREDFATRNPILMRM